MQMQIDKKDFDKLLDLYRRIKAWRKTDYDDGEIELLCEVEEWMEVVIRLPLGDVPNA